MRPSPPSPLATTIRARRVRPGECGHRPARWSPTRQPNRVRQAIMAEGQPTVADVAELAEALHRVLMALNLRAHRRDRSRLAIGELTVAQLSILLTLRDHGRIRTSKLSVVERVVTVAIRRLATLGLVKRSRDTADLRLVFVELTRKGL